MAVNGEPGEQNRILAALAASGAASRVKSEEVPLRRGDVLIDSGHGHSDVYFPHNGLISLFVVMPDGAAAEAAVVGREGLAGHPYLADFDAAPAQAIVQLEGRATRISGDDFFALLRADEIARDVIGNFARAFVAQTLQTVACNALHGLGERLAKWLLHCADRVEGAVPLTHEFLAEMLGVSRPTVSLTARTFQAAELIRYSRGNIEILDKEGLEDVACPCYSAVRHAYEQLLPLTYA